MSARTRRRACGTPSTVWVRSPRPVLYFETIGSTNDVAASLASSGAGEGAVVIADAQTAGRGRRGRTLVFAARRRAVRVGGPRRRHARACRPERATALLTLAAGVALSEAVERVTGLAPAIKWPNDLLVGRRKLAGILAEGVAAPSAVGLQAVVLGFGINVQPAAYPPELAARVTSLETELGRAIDRAALCAESLAALSRPLPRPARRALRCYSRRLAPARVGSRGARVEWDTPSGVRAGITEGIDDMGALLVRTARDRSNGSSPGKCAGRLHAASD